MSTLVVVGAQWGDEGKGKVVDALAAQAEMVVRFGGGNNAGHTLVLGESKMVTHLVPSGCRYPGTACVLGSGMVIDPDVLMTEVGALRERGLLAGDELRVALDAHVIFPYHRDLDGLREDRGPGRVRLGTTRRGIGPAYESKFARRGIRVRDLFDPAGLRERLLVNKDLLEPELVRLSDGAHPGIDVDVLLRGAERWATFLAPAVCDAANLVHDAVVGGRRVLFEGAQGALLDIDHGTYPYVTSASTVAGGACTGVGIGPTLIDRVWGITKAYATRVGRGPMPTKLEGEVGDRLREAGAEYGATTGRPRDCGWLDLPALRYAARVGGLTGLCVTKLDVLATLPGAQVCVAYQDGMIPGRDLLEHAVPQLRPLAGWDDLPPGPELGRALGQARRLEDLPSPIRAFLDLVQAEVGVPIVLISVGPERAQTIALADAFAG